jgi:hypothetical protein
MAFCLPRTAWGRGLLLLVVLLHAGDVAPAQDRRPPPLLALAAVLCVQGELENSFRGGFLPLMGFAAKAQPMRTLRASGRYLMIPPEQCRDGQPSDRVRLIIWHIVRRGEGRYYLAAAATGELIVAVEGIAANNANYLLASNHDPDIMIDFGDEKAFWLARLADDGARR